MKINEISFGFLVYISYIYYVKVRDVNITTKRNKVEYRKWNSVTEFYVNGILICEYKTGSDYFGSRSSNYRNVRKNCRETVWNESGLSRVLGKDIKVGGNWRAGNSVFFNDSPSNSYTGSVLTKKQVEELIEEAKS